jgi:RND family efflux transporter MFP subunit
MNAKIIFSSISDKTFKGTISEIGKSTSGASTYPLIISLSNNDDEILPGMACKIKLTFKQNENTKNYVIIPIDAVAHDEDGDFVYTLTDNEEKDYFIAKRKNITLGKLKANGYEVKDGLNHGEKIITAGLSFMYDGRKVKLLYN